MMKDFGLENNAIVFSNKRVIFDQAIKEIVEYENCVIVRTKYTKENADRNVVSIDYNGNILWNIQNIKEVYNSLPAVSIGRYSDEIVNIVTFGGIKVLVNSNTGQVLEKVFTK